LAGQGLIFRFGQFYCGRHGHHGHRVVRAGGCGRLRLLLFGGDASGGGSDGNLPQRSGVGEVRNARQRRVLQRRLKGVARRDSRDRRLRGRRWGRSWESNSHARLSACRVPGIRWDRGSMCRRKLLIRRVALPAHI
jgi:hypothetical protein